MNRNIKWLVIGLLSGVVLSSVIGLLIVQTWFENSDTNGSIKTSMTWLQVGAGISHSIAIAEDKYGTGLWAWGDDYCGKLGVRKDDFLPVGALTKLNIAGGDWQVVACGQNYTMAIDSAGLLWAWGENYYGQLGLGDITKNESLYKFIPVSNSERKVPYVNSPIKVGADNDYWKTVSCGLGHTVAIKSDGTIWAWGDNSNGELGIGNAIRQFSPVQVSAETTWEKIRCSDWHTFAIKTDGTLWAWGNNNNGQLGLGDLISRTTPTKIGTESDWKTVDSRNGHILAIRADGTLWAWGKNDYGQLGLGDTVVHISPVQIGKANNWKMVACGDDYTLAIKTDGTLWAWGKNDYGQLGLNNIVNHISPVQVGNATNWKHISCGGLHTLALKTDNTLWVWGNNSDGQLGLQSVIVIPTQVIIKGSN
ncbi:MAG: hypothetical protein HZA49_01595 [Planctomycetes bacterium]|nr:hypothetical protein [Planctomycetota bacterium]